MKSRAVIVQLISLSMIHTAKAIGDTTLVSLFLNWKTTDWWQQRFLVGGFVERYSFTDPPIPAQNFPGSLYIAKAFNVQADWQNTFELSRLQMSSLRARPTIWRPVTIIPFPCTRRMISRFTCKINGKLSRI